MKGTHMSRIWYPDTGYVKSKHALSVIVKYTRSWRQLFQKQRMIQLGVYWRKRKDWPGSIGGWYVAPATLQYERHLAWALGKFEVGFEKQCEWFKDEGVPESALQEVLLELEEILNQESVTENLELYKEVNGYKGFTWGPA